MKTVKIKKDKLLKKLKENRETHRNNFLEAQKGYRQEAIEQFDKALKNARDGKPIITYFNLTAPVDQTFDYDTIIEMLDWEVEEIVELDQSSFKNYVLDEWNWKQDWLCSNSAYMKKARE